MKLALDYLAGVWDSDGSINISLNKNHGFPSYRIQCQLTWLKFNHSVKVINEIKKMFGGSVFEEQRKKLTKNTYIAYKVDSLGAKRLLETIEPYLILKRSQAQTALKLQSLKKPQGYYGKGNSQPEKERVIFGKLYVQCKMLNKQGKVM